MQKNFDQWNTLIKRLDRRRVNVYCHEKEIWWCNLGLNVGCEENGKNVNFERPVLILKKISKEMLWVLPTTSKIKNNQFYYKIFYRGRYYSVILSQLRIISSRRLLRKIWFIKTEEFKKIKRIIKDLL